MWLRYVDQVMLTRWDILGGIVVLWRLPNYFTTARFGSLNGNQHDKFICHADLRLIQ
jgi:drug/metabolite transporter superfamily protein YnfA